MQRNLLAHSHRHAKDVPPPSSFRRLPEHDRDVKIMEESRLEDSDLSRTVDYGART